MGNKDCPGGSEILDKEECEQACTRLGINLSNALKNGKPCFKAGDGLCRQSSSTGLKAQKVCKQSGKVIFYINLENIPRKKCQPFI